MHSIDDFPLGFCDDCAFYYWLYRQILLKLYILEPTVPRDSANWVHSATDSAALETWVVWLAVRSESMNEGPENPATARMYQARLGHAGLPFSAALVNAPRTFVFGGSISRHESFWLAIKIFNWNVLTVIECAVDIHEELRVWACTQKLWLSKQWCCHNCRSSGAVITVHAVVEL